MNANDLAMKRPQRNTGIAKYKEKLFSSLNKTANGLDISLFPWVMRLFIIMHIPHASKYQN